MIDDELLERVNAVPSSTKRLLLRSLYATATAQRSLAERRLTRYNPPTPPRVIDADVVTLARESDRLLLWRMLHTMLKYAGEPRSLHVVWDGAIRNETRELVENMASCIRVVSSRWAVENWPLPTVVRRFAALHPFGRKLAVMLRPPAGRPYLYLDCDIAFFRGAWRLQRYLQDSDSPRYMLDGTSLGSYDLRMLPGLPLLPAVNAGFALVFDPLDWEVALKRLAPYVQSATHVTEQTAFAIAMTTNRGKPLPISDFVLSWEDCDRPWDAYATRDIVLRHYASPILRWKLWLKGRPTGPRWIPYSYIASLASSLRRASDHAGTAS
jgi:hypothetical protein